MDLKTFESIMEIAGLAKKYDQKAQVSQGLEKQIYEQYVLELDDLYDKLLRIGKYAETNEAEIAGVMKESVNGISAYTQVHILRRYDNGYSLVMATSMELYLVPNESVTIQ